VHHRTRYRHACLCLFGACAALLATAGASRAATISGYVREHGSRESMPYVSVYLEGSRMGATTNTSGYYAISGVPPGRQVLVAALVGYAEYRDTLDVGTSPIVRNIELAPAAIELETVKVEAERVRSPSLEIVPSRETFRGADLKVAPAAIEADPIRTLMTLPGVMQLSDFNTGLYVRGGTPDQNLILVDGAELYNVSHFFGLFSTFPADAIKSTELLLGGFPAQYGGRLSSVLNVTTDEGNKEHFSGLGGVSLLSSRLTLQGPVAKGSWLLSGRRTYLEPVLWMASKSTDALDGLGYYFYDFQGKVHQVLSHNDQVSVAGYLGRDRFAYDDPPVMHAKIEWGNWSASAVWTHLFSDQLFSHNQFYVSHFKSRATFKMEDFGAADVNELFDVDAKTDVTWYANDRHTLETGFHLKRHHMRFGQEAAGQKYEAFDLVAYVPSAYVEDSWRPWPFLTLQPGLRTSFFRVWDANSDAPAGATYYDLDPRLSVRCQIARNTYLKASVGHYTQYLFRVAREAQGINFMSDIWFTCDSTAPPQHAWHFITGLETKLSRDVDVTLEGYYKDFRQIAEFNFNAWAPKSAGEALLRGDGYAYGVDLGIQKRAGRHRGWISYSLGWTVRDIEGINRDGEGISEPYHPKYEQRHSLNLVYTYRISHRWSVNSRYGFASGQGYTKQLGWWTIEDPVYRIDPIYRDRLNARRVPYYSRLDMGVQGRFRKWGATWMPSLQIVNVLNRKNVFNVYQTTGDPTADPPKFSEEKQIPQLPFLPTIGLDVEF